MAYTQGTTVIRAGTKGAGREGVGGIGGGGGGRIH